MSLDHNAEQGLEALRQFRDLNGSIQRQAVITAIQKLLEVHSGTDFEVECMRAAANLKVSFGISDEEVES